MCDKNVNGVEGSEKKKVEKAVQDLEGNLKLETLKYK